LLFAHVTVILSIVLFSHFLCSKLLNSLLTRLP